MAEALEAMVYVMRHDKRIGEQVVSRLREQRALLPTRADGQPTDLVPARSAGQPQPTRPEAAHPKAATVDPTRQVPRAPGGQSV